MTKSDYEEWSNLPLTIEFFQYMKDYRQLIMEAWANGDFTLDSIEASTMRNIESLSKAQMLQSLTEMDSGHIEEFYRSK